MTCRRHVDLDVQAVVDRLGEDYGRLHRDLIKVLFCQPCREAERPDRNNSFTSHPKTPKAMRGLGNSPPHGV